MSKESHYRIRKGSILASELSSCLPPVLCSGTGCIPDHPHRVNTSTSWCGLHFSQTHWWCCRQVGPQLTLCQAATSLHRLRLASTYLLTRQQTLAALTVSRAGRCMGRLTQSIRCVQMSQLDWVLAYHLCSSSSHPSACSHVPRHLCTPLGQHAPDA